MGKTRWEERTDLPYSNESEGFKGGTETGSAAFPSGAEAFGVSSRGSREPDSARKARRR